MGTIPTIPAVIAGGQAQKSWADAVQATSEFWARPPGCSAYDDVGFTVPNNAYTSVPLTAEVFDRYQAGDSPMHDLATNNSRITIRTAGVYRVSGACLFTLNATGIRSVRWIKNGSTAVEYGFNTDQAASGNNTSIVMATIDEPLAAGDYIEMQAFQNRGGTLALIPGRGKSFFSAVLVADV